MQNLAPLTVFNTIRRRFLIVAYFFGPICRNDVLINFFYAIVTLPAL